MVAAADLVLLTVPDDVLPGLVAGLAATGAALEGRLLAHASGRHGLAVLEPAVRAGALPLALHPVMTFTGRRDDLDKLAGSTFGVTAPDPLRPVAEALVLEMGGEPVFIADERRELYHAALASAANHLVTLVDQADRPAPGGRGGDPARMLGPLLYAALDNALRLGDAALTGPVARGDADTVAGHIAALRTAAPQALPAYLALARLTADRALAAGTLSAPDAQRLLAVLGGPPRDAGSGTGLRGQHRRGHWGGAPRPVLARTRAELAAAAAGLPGPVVLVPTMGALHAGHRALLRLARELSGPAAASWCRCSSTRCSSGRARTSARYPRTLEPDLAICARGGCRAGVRPGRGGDVPGRAAGPGDPGPVGQLLEGSSRPGFFTGVLTVVLKLFQLVRPDIAVFGQKDAQQIALVRQMTADLDLGVKVEAVPIVRDPDGLAVSSRNAYLSAAERSTALALSRARWRPGPRPRAAGGPAAVLAAAGPCWTRRRAPTRRWCSTTWPWWTRPRSPRPGTATAARRCCWSRPGPGRPG